MRPRPAKASVVALNPPGFAWPACDGAAAYRLILGRDPRLRGGRQVFGPVPRCHAVLPLPLPPGEWWWAVEALAADGTVLDRRPPWLFEVPPGALTMPVPPAGELLSWVRRRRPRLAGDDWSQRRAEIMADPVRWPRLRRLAEAALLSEPPTLPDYPRRDADPMVRGLAGRANFDRLAASLEGGLATLALAYTVSGEERFGFVARDRLLLVAGWLPGGASSLLAAHGDPRPAMSVLRCGPRLLDHLDDLFDDGQRRQVEDMLGWRAEECYRWLSERVRYHEQPTTREAGRLLGFLGEHALALANCDEAVAWLDYVLGVLVGCFPYWGGDDGGWVDGPAYQAVDLLFLMPFLRSLREATGVDLFRLPHLQAAGRWRLYRTVPGDAIAPFGDGRCGWPGCTPLQEKGLLLALAEGRGDGLLAWAATREAADEPGHHAYGLLEATVCRPPEPTPPSPDLPLAAVFEQVGEAAFHSSLTDPGQDVCCFLRSSPEGSCGHAHADQNNLALYAGGWPLLAPSGYDAPFTGSPHHQHWTRTTEAACSLLVDGSGQCDQTRTAAGRLIAWQHNSHAGYVAGEAGAAYLGRLRGWRRRVLFFQPGGLLVIDEVASDRPCRPQLVWHTPGEFELGLHARRIRIANGPAAASLYLLSPSGLRVRQSAGFPTSVYAARPGDAADRTPADDPWGPYPADRRVVVETTQPTCWVRVVTLILVHSANLRPSLARSQDERLAVARFGTALGDRMVAVCLDDDESERETAGWRWSGRAALLSPSEGVLFAVGWDD